jgi:hypothetical protein
MSSEFLSRLAAGEKIKKVGVKMTPEGTFGYEFA